MSQEKIRVLVVDDHAVVREGLRALIEGKADMQLAGEAADGEEAVRQALVLRPDVILMDLVMPRKTGIQAIGEIRGQNPNARILVLTSFGEDEQVFAAIKGGALGYLLKDSSPQELLEAIRCVHRGESSLHPAVARKLVIGVQNPISPTAPETSAPESPVAGLPAGLTDREVVVLRLMAQGLSNQEIASELVIGEGTVRFHVSNILSKTQLENRTQAVLYALRTGLASL